jgi:hypothetical protein
MRLAALGALSLNECSSDRRSAATASGTITNSGQHIQLDQPGPGRADSRGCRSDPRHPVEVERDQRRWSSLGGGWLDKLLASLRSCERGAELMDRGSLGGHREIALQAS